MYKLTKLLSSYFGSMIQIVTWSDLLERAFRPVIKPNTVVNGSTQSGMVRFSPVYCPIEPFRRSTFPLDR